MKVVQQIALSEIKDMAEKMFGELVKADVDVAKRLVIIDMAMHYEGEAYLLEHGSHQNDIWGINLHPADYGTADFIEFDSMINIRPSQGNTTKDVLDESIRQQIRDIIAEVVNE